MLIVLLATTTEADLHQPRTLDAARRRGSPAPHGALQDRLDCDTPPISGMPSSSTDDGPRQRRRSWKGTQSQGSSQLGLGRPQRRLLLYQILQLEYYGFVSGRTRVPRCGISSHTLETTDEKDPGQISGGLRRKTNGSKPANASHGDRLQTWQTYQHGATHECRRRGTIFSRSSGSVAGHVAWRQVPSRNRFICTHSPPAKHLKTRRKNRSGIMNAAATANMTAQDIPSPGAEPVNTQAPIRS